MRQPHLPLTQRRDFMRTQLKSLEALSTAEKKKVGPPNRTAEKKT